ncbi:Mannan endo-1,4-beta-mannosidase 1 [Acorus gramineus]|uniref:mannan endo-1,4-beta-mannosidase n=1 Tax=Acorus gramineus TaxID=55184 RepID=A0AAV9BR73_ACOGR|nr:Mannan endo-1,4-beta-mannosidase 1 [Acorus gramineus]
MATKVKSIDSNHLLEVGLEGIYGDSMPDRKKFNPGGLMFGTDFISNNQISGIDFATIHTYPDQWLTGSDFQAQINFLKSWTQTHISDSNSVLRKPLLVTEFGKNTTAPGTSITQRDTFYSSAYDLIYASASGGGSGCGALFWQWLADGMDQFRDGYEVVISKSPSTALIISSASHKLIGLDH